MACSAVRYPLLRNPQVRHYAVAAAAQCSPATTNVKTLNNKVTVAALDNKAPVTQVSIIFKASSRNETYDTQGIAHMIRLCTPLSTSRSSGFAITRNIQQLGGDLSVNADREYISYTLKITRDNLGKALTYFEDAATKQQFRPWEIIEEIPRLRYEVSAVPNNVRVVELLYKAAFREGLGYSLYCPKRHIGQHNSENLAHFVENYHTASRCAVVGSGLQMSEVEALAGILDLPSKESNTTPSKYRSGEVRKERNSELATVALAVEGASLQNRKDAIAFAVLQKVAGEGPQVKWGGCNTPLHKTMSAADQGPFAAIAFNASHSDSGLFGLILSAPYDIAGKLAQAGAKWLRSPTFSNEDVTRGKNALKAAVLAAGDNDSLQHENMGYQALFTGTIASANSIVDDIEKISATDLKSVADKVSRGKISMAAIGNLSKVPYLDQL